MCRGYHIHQSGMELELGPSVIMYESGGYGYGDDVRELIVSLEPGAIVKVPSALTSGVVYESG